MNINRDGKEHNLLSLSESDFERFLSGDENPPIFYKPKAVVTVSKWLYKLSYLSIFIVLLLSIDRLLDIREGARQLSELLSLTNTLSWMLSGSIQILTIAVRFFFYYFGFRAIASGLIILMEMEFNSRKKNT